MKYKLLLLLILSLSSCNIISPECVETSQGCCKGDICNQGEILCAEGYESKFLGCDENCQEELTCVPA